MTRSSYAAWTLVGEIVDTYGDAVSVAHVGDPDGWGVLRALAVSGKPAAEVAEILEDRHDSRIERVVLLGDTALVQFRPRADDTSPFGIGSAHRSR